MKSIRKHASAIRRFVAMSALLIVSIFWSLPAFASHSKDSKDIVISNTKWVDSNNNSLRCPPPPPDCVCPNVNVNVSPLPTIGINVT